MRFKLLRTVADWIIAISKRASWAAALGAIGLVIGAYVGFLLLPTVLSILVAASGSAGLFLGAVLGVEVDRTLSIRRERQKAQREIDDERAKALALEEGAGRADGRRRIDFLVQRREELEKHRDTALRAMIEISHLQLAAVKSGAQIEPRALRRVVAATKLAADVADAQLQAINAELDELRPEPRVRVGAPELRIPTLARVLTAGEAQLREEEAEAETEADDESKKKK